MEQSAKPSPIRAGDVVGRYVVVDRLGAGGMGTVFSAYDRELDRKVALKVLQVDALGQAGGQKRLVREAQAMAKLDHPNVVTVFDVGEHDGRVFVAMEFVRGTTLRAWQTQDRRWTEIVEAYRQAARGLFSAHDAGLIHRDFKPDNAMVDAKGRVRVMDFGLVRAQGPVVTEIPTIDERKVLEAGAEAEAEAANDAMARIRGRMEKLGKLGTSTTVAATEPSAREADGRMTGENALADQLTHAGTIMGTPAYMSPEQLRGESVDARSDQFSFCIALYEALYGERPFGAGALMEILQRIETGQIEPAPADTMVPSEVREAITRGLDADPQRRHPTMAVLDETIARLVQPKPLRMAWPVGITLAAVVAASVWAYGHREPPCQGAPAQAAAVWDNAHRTAVRAAFAEVGAGFARDSGERTVAAIDGYMQRWTTDHRAACEATEVRREQSSAMLDRRMACLDQSLRAVGALVGVLANADLVAVENGPQAAQRLPSLERCSDPAALLARVAPPEDPQVQAKVEEIDARLVQVRTEVAAGHFATGAELAQAAVDEAGETGYGPILARANLELGVALDYDGKHEAAQVALRKAALEARAASEDTVAADAEARLVFVAGVRRQKFDRGRWWADHARAAARRATRPEATMAVDNNLGALLVAARESDLGLEHLQRALAQRREALGPEHPDTLESLNNVAIALRSQGRYDESRAAYEDLVAQRIDVNGPLHPFVGTARNGLAATLIAQQQWGDAAATLDGVLQLQEAAYGRDHPAVISTLVTLGYVELERGELSTAGAKLDEAVALSRAVHGPEHPATLRARFNRARVVAERGDRQAGSEILREVLAGRIKSLGEDHPAVARTRALLKEYGGS